MKKILVIVLAALLAAALFYACSRPYSPTDGAPGDDGTAQADGPGLPFVAASPKTFEITFDENYEGGSSTTVTVKGNAPLRPYFSGGVEDMREDTSLAPEYRFKPRRENASFGGWFTDVGCTERLDEEAVAAQDATLYAGWRLWDEEDIGNMALVRDELVLGREIVLTPRAYEKTGFDRYYDVYRTFMLLFGLTGAVPGERTIGFVEELKRSRESLVQIADPEAARWDIWGEGMPVEDGSQYFDFSESWDNEGFRPCLTPYMLRDQAGVKGNIIIISGGGFVGRANDIEGYPTAEKFNELGYNVFVLQRRVAPYAPIDASIDLQRAVRFIKCNAEGLGIGGIDFIAACGFSGGGITILGMLGSLGSHGSPSAVYPSYSDDDVDSASAGIQAAITIYGVVGGYDYDLGAVAANPDLPAMFVVAGAEDETAEARLSIDLYTAVEGKVPAELVVFSDAPHGFGSGLGSNPANNTKENVANVQAWPSMADTFMQIQRGSLQNITPAEAP